MTSREKSWLAALAILAVLALVELFYLPGPSRLLQEVNNAGHMAVFGILAVAALHLVKAVRPSLRQKPFTAYVLAFGVACTLGAASELVQYYSPRDASFEDLARDILGAASFLALYAAIRDRDLQSARQAGPAFKKRLLTLTAVLWLAGGWSLLLWSTAFAHRSLNFPVLCDFDSWLSTRFLDPNQVRLESGVESDSSGTACRGTRVHFEGTNWPGVTVTEVCPDWRDYDSLIVEVCFEGARPLRLGLAVSDRKHNQQWNDRFTTRFDLDPGRHVLGVSLGRVLQGPASRELEMGEIYAVSIFTDSTGVGQSVLLERLLLK